MGTTTSGSGAVAQSKQGRDDALYNYNYMHKFKNTNNNNKKSDAERLSTASGQKLTGIIFFSCASASSSSLSQSHRRLRVDGH
jgi:hypothetical protein